MNNRPYCAPRSHLLCGKLECKACTPRSFHGHEKAQYWSNKNTVKPHQLFRKEQAKYLFDCPCGHEILKSIRDISFCGTWCPYCAGAGSHSLLCENNDCKPCHNRSFASVPRSKHLHPDCEINPRMTFKGSGTIKCKFICEKEHIFISTPATVDSGVWCPFCFNKTEDDLLKRFMANGFVDVEPQIVFDWSVNKETGRQLRYDFLIERLKLIIELDGDQHFRDVDVWNSEVINVRKRDILKMDLAISNGYSVLRLSQMEVSKNVTNWWDEMLKNLYKRDVPTKIYILGNGRYDNFELIDDKKVVD